MSIAFEVQNIIMYDPLNTGSPFQNQLTILQNAINNWYTLRDNISDPRAETLPQTGMIHVLYVIIAKYVPFQRHLMIIKKSIFFIVC